MTSRKTLHHWTSYPHLVILLLGHSPSPKSFSSKWEGGGGDWDETIDHIQLMSAPHVTGHETDSGWKARYYTALLRKKRLQSIECKYQCHTHLPLLLVGCSTSHAHLLLLLVRCSTSHAHLPLLLVGCITGHTHLPLLLVGYSTNHAHLPLPLV